LLQKWQKVKTNLMRNNVAYPMASEDAASRVAHKFWPSSDIMAVGVMQSHFLPKLLTRVTGLTRVERYAMVVTSLSLAFFCMTFWFSADCFMVPKPPICILPKVSTFEKYFGFLIPSWNAFFGAIFGIIAGSFPPFILTTIFRKPVVLARLSATEKDLQRNWWRMQATVGWSITIGVNVWSIYFLIAFSHNYNWIVFRKFLNSVVQGMFHRTVTSPFGRGLAIGLLVLGARLFDPCDTLIIYCCPHILPVARLATLPGGERTNDDAEAGNDDADDGGDAGDDGGNASTGIGEF